MQNIMVQAADYAWTLEALHRAGSFARRTDARIALVKMVPVQYLAWLGTAFGSMHLSGQDWEDIQSYTATLEDYGVEFSVVVFQYATLPDAIADAADYVQADGVYATIDGSIIPGWKRFQQWRLCRCLLQHHHILLDASKAILEPTDLEAPLAPAVTNPTH